MYVGSDSIQVYFGDGDICFSLFFLAFFVNPKIDLGIYS